MGAKSSKYNPHAPRKTGGKLPGLKKRSGPCENIYYGGHGDNKTQWSNNEMKLLKPLPPHEYCPHCNRLVRTSAEIEAELKRFIKEAKKQLRKECNFDDQEDKEKFKTKHFAGIKKMSRPISYLEQQESESKVTERILPPNPQMMTKVDEIKNEGIYDEVSVDPILAEGASLDLSIHCVGDSDDDEYQTPRSLQLPDDMWHY